MNGLIFRPLAAGLTLIFSLLSLSAQDRVLITEFVASNTSGLRDEDGAFSDWIELYNAGTNVVNLAGWYLTDRTNDLTQWSFPATNIAPGQYLVVFASGKDRKTIGAPLHTSFGLSSGGEYLGLIKPDQVTIASEYRQQALQVANVSFGLSQSVNPQTLITNDSPLSVLVPTDGTLALTWTTPEFDDTEWLHGPNAVGFDTGAPQPGEPYAQLAHQYTFDNDTPNDSIGTLHGTPLTTLNFDTGRSGGRALSLNGTNDALSFPSNDFTGNFTLEFWIRPARKLGIQTLLANTPSGFTSNGFRFYVNDLNTSNGLVVLESGNATSGATTKSQTAVDFDQWNHLILTVERTAGRARIYKNGLDVTHPTTRSLRMDFKTAGPWQIGQMLNNTNAYQGLIDYCAIWEGILETSQIAALAAGAPATNLTVFGPLIQTDLRGYMHNQNPSAFIRLPFQVSDPAAVSSLKLRARRDDGFVAYINGVEIARRNAPSFAIGGTIADSQTQFSGTQGQNGWHYGYYNKTTDTDGTYQANNFTAFPASYWNGTIWNWPAGDPPWTELTATGGHPNGINNGPDHWAVRRWESDVTGTLTVNITLKKGNVGGNGITGRIFHNGVQRYSRAITGTDTNGATTNIIIPDVIAGDFIDFAIDSLGTDSQINDGFDGTIFTARVDQQASPPLEWNSTALTSNPNSQGTQFEQIDLFGGIRWLNSGANVLAVHGLNVASTNSDFFFEAELEAGISTELDPSAARYFIQPTPGGPNGTGVADLGPVILNVTNSPAIPLYGEAITVTARITPSFGPVASNTLFYRVMFQAEVPLTMLDNGLNGDGIAGDGVFGARIPGGVATNGQMIRWYIRSVDTSGRVSRWPFYQDPNNSPEYLGTMVDLPQTNNLPVLHWFVQNAAGAATDAGTRCSLFYLGEFYDNCYINLHGQSSRDASFLRKPYDIDFNPGYHFHWDPANPEEPRVDDINLLQTYSDKAKMRNMLAYGTYKDAGSPYHYVVPVRVQQNGVYYADYHIVENGDAGYLERIGRDPNGALYKMYNTFTTTAHATIGSGNAEKKTRKFEGNADLLALFNGLTSATNRAYIYDNLNIAEALNSIAVRALTADLDCCHKNYYFYRNSVGTGEWECHPWDVDLSFGRNWTECSNYWGDNMHPENGLLIGGNNSFYSPLFAGGTLTRQMYYRRFRTLMDELLQAPGTPIDELKYEAQIDHWVEMIEPDAALEKTRWATWGNCASPTNCCTQSVAHAALLMKTNFLPEFRRRIFNRINNNTTDIPNSQPTNAVLVVAGLDFNPVSSNQLEEYIQIRNTNLYAVDISGWNLWSGVRDASNTNLNLIHTFQGGVVIPATNSVYVVPNKRAFRSRAVAPRGGMQLYVEGEYEGQLSARGELIELTDKLGHKVISTNYPGNPSPQQLYLRVTEIMYHPALLVNNTNGPEEFEYIELKNISTNQSLSLLGVRFINGISFNFSTGSITTLAPLQTVLLVKNLAAFTARYGSGRPIAGVYGGNLDNGGERIRLDDGMGEKILDFDYNNSWYPSTDGLGFSLVIVNENAPWNTWDEKESWRPSGREHGSPGQDDPAPFNVSPVLINELVSNSDSPPTDMIEIYNPNTNDVNIAGWFLSDDFLTPRKYRIPAGTIIRAGSYMTFDESQFNSNPFLPTSFAFSSDNDEAFIFSADSNTNLTGFFHGFDFGASDPDVSFGRYLTSDANEEFVAQSQRTFGTNNAYPRVGPIVISEIMYHPPDGPGGRDNSDDEYIELYNLSTTNVPLYDLSRPTNTWQLRDAVEFAFPRNVTLGPSNFLLVVSFNPAETGKLNAFRTRYGLDSSVSIYGPYNGKLDNSSDSVELYRPGVPLAQRVPYVRIDRVEYEDLLPWPESADGAGPALQRLDAQAYGNDPVNWGGGLSPGSRPGGTAPQITEQPLSQTVLAGTNITLTVSATGTSPLIYQWRRNGANITGNGNTLPLLNAKPNQSGSYDVIVFNPAGSAQSSNAVVDVVVPLKITGNPGHVRTNLGATAVFSVGVTSPRPVTYQWRKNGVDIPGANSPTYSISNVSRDHEGDYTVFVQDAVSNEESAVAILLILIPPRLSLQPLSATVVVGTDVSFTGAVSNNANPLPLTFRWRRDGSFFTNIVVSNFSQTLTLPNVRTNEAATYTLVVTNVAGSTIGLSSNAYLIVVIPPTNQIVSPGTNVTIVAQAGLPRATGLPRPIRFQWQFGGSNIVNATNLTLTVTNVQAANTGTYTLVVYNPADTDATAARFPVEIQFASLKARFSETTLSGDGSFHATIEGVANRTYSVEFSTDMTNWTELRSIVMTNSSVPFVDEQATNATQKFYRATLAD